MLVKTFGSACYGVKAITITIEEDASPGLGFSMVGLPDSAVKESQQRISTTLQTIGLRMSGRKVVINMAPADIRKEGSAYDLPLAVGMLAASGQLNAERVSRYVLMGELSLDNRRGLYTGFYAGYGLPNVAPSANNAVQHVRRINLLSAGAKVKMTVGK
jgi:magnesium chelatase family protein